MRRTSFLALLVFALAGCTVTPAMSNPGGVLYARSGDHDQGGDLWRCHLGSGQLERLTLDDALHWVSLPEAERQHELDCCKPTVSPDAAWLTFSPYTPPWSPALAVYEPPYTILQPLAVPGPTQVVTGTRQIAAWSPDSRRAAYTIERESPWWPDDAPLLWVHDVAQGISEPLGLLDPAVEAIGEIVWSPDGSAIAYLARLAATAPGTDPSWQVQRLDFASQQASVVGTAEVGTASSPSICWAEGNAVVIGWQAGARCSHDPAPCGGNCCAAPGDSRKATVLPAPGADATRVSVQGPDGSVLWERTLKGVRAERVWWSADGTVLVLGGRGGPIWRVPSDGSGAAEAIVDEGTVVAIVPQW